MCGSCVSFRSGNLSEVMINKSDASDVKPFTGLSPDVVLDAAASVGLDVDGRLFALNSYENRVYQLGSPGGSLVLKFYRPERWTDEQSGEEHQFTPEMGDEELTVVAAVVVEGRTLFTYSNSTFASFPWTLGRARELDSTEARQLLVSSLA